MGGMALLLGVVVVASLMVPRADSWEDTSGVVAGD